MRPTDRSV